LRVSDYKKINILIITVCFLLYAINRYTAFDETEGALLRIIWNYHFTDYLCIIVYFAVCNIFFDIFKRKGLYSLHTILIYSLLSCFAWEICVGFLNRYAVADLFDCLAYLLGGITYYLLFRFMTLKEENDE